MKKIISACLAVLFIISALGICADAASPFADVSDDMWYTSASVFCYLNEYMTGTGHDSFDPSGKTTRAQVAVILAKVSGAELSSPSEQRFDDVSVDSWYAAAVEFISENNIATGTGAGKFSPLAVMTREQFALILMNFAKYAGADTSARADISSFADNASASSWATDALRYAVASGLISGIKEPSGTVLLVPKGELTRAQIAVIIRNFVLDTLRGDHEHDIQAASCTEPSKCKVCGIKLDMPAGHDTPTLSCTDSCECLRCREVIPALGHVPREATCTSPSTCERCGETLAPALGHTVSYGICGRCGADIFPNECERVKFYLKINSVTADKPYTAVSAEGGKTKIYYDPASAGVVIDHDYSDKTGNGIRIRLFLADTSASQYIECGWYGDGGNICFATGHLNIASYVNSASSVGLTNIHGSEVLRGQFDRLAKYYLFDALKCASSILGEKLSATLPALGFTSIAL